MPIPSMVPYQAPDKLKIFMFALVPNLGFWFGSATYIPQYYCWYTRKYSKNIWHELLGRIHLNAMTTRNFILGIASFFIWEKGHGFGELAPPLTAYAAMMGLYWTYHPVLFHFRWYGLSLAHVLTMATTSLITTKMFWRVSKPAGLFMIPFLFYVAYATYLNTICVLCNDDDCLLDA